jgi:catechol 2,3-dioxygenase-like lactoylglutathione lyase family enzyme
MLGHQKIVGFIPTTDFEQARSFYEGQLGLGYRDNDGFALELDANGTRVRIAKIPDFKPAAFTIFGWEVQAIHQVVASLTNKGIVFERYNFLEQDIAGVWTAPGGDKVAWFKDPDGNILSLSEHVKAV